MNRNFPNDRQSDEPPAGPSMLRTTAPEAMVLAWVANPAISMEQPYDPDILIQAALRNKMTLRLLAALRKRRPKWTSGALEDALAKDAETFNRVIEERLTELRRISQFISPLEPPIYIKGATTFLLTGNEETRKFSNDIDLVAKDPEDLVTRLRSAGYTESDDYCRSHEFASVNKGHLNIDVHRYFPVLSPPDRRSDEFQPAIERKLTYDLLIEKSTGLADVAAFRLPHSEACGFISAAHLYREYYHTPTLLPYATVRLGEALDFELLCGQGTPVTEWVSELEATHSISFVRDFLSAIRSGGTRGLGNLPHDLWLPGFTTYTTRGTNALDLLVRPPSQDGALEFAALDATEVDVPTGKGPIRLGSEMSISSGVVPTTRLAVDAMSDRVAISATVDCDASDRLVVLVSAGDIFYEVATESTLNPVTRRRRNVTRKKEAGENAKWKLSLEASAAGGRGWIQLAVMVEAAEIGFEDLRGHTLLVGLRLENGDSGLDQALGAQLWAVRFR